jgi:hypothetical protein
MTKERLLRPENYDAPGVKIYDGRFVQFLDEPDVYYTTTGRQLTPAEVAIAGLPHNDAIAQAEALEQQAQELERRAAALRQQSINSN